MTTIRPYTSADREACLQLFRSNMPKFFDPTELPLFERFLSAQELGVSGKTEHRNEHYFVLLDGETIVGCGGIALKDNNTVCMAWGMVDNSLHKKGYGARLLEYRIAKSRELYPTAKIGLDTTQHSEGFFARFGFKTWKVTADFYASGMDRYDMVWEEENR